ncbi:MAG TPA: flagellar assembly protein T N-terminal domain-containing protein [bacterium]|jgi:hypothetical protein
MKLTLTILFILISIAPSWAQTFPAGTVTARGEATIYGGDIAAAREEALVDAQRNALEQVLGVKIRSETAVQDFALADDAILSMVAGFVSNVKILSEKQEGENLSIEIQCDVARELSDEEAAPQVRNFACVLGLTVEIDGQKTDDDRFVNKLSADLVKAGFDVRDASQLRALKGFDEHLATAGKQDVEAARWIGRQMLANVVIVGKASLKQTEKKEVTSYTGAVGVYAYDAWTEARAIETTTGQIIAQSASQVAGVRGVGDTPQKAVTEALANAERQLSADLLNQLAAYRGRKLRPITVEISGIPSYEKFQIIKGMLNSIRFRESEVSDLGFQEGKTSSFQFDYSENINLIASKLERLPYLSVVEKTAGKVICRYAAER